MPDRNSSYVNKTCRSKNFILFLASQGISNLGDAFHFIAATTLLVNITGSGLSAAFGLVCTPLLSIAFSSFAGYVGDNFRNKRILIMLDFFRGLVVLLFISNFSIHLVYVLIISLSCLEIFYNPSRRKLIASILNENELIKGYSLLSGVTGTAFILGPVIAGILISHYGPDIAFFINSLSFFISAVIIPMIKHPPSCSVIRHSRMARGSMQRCIEEGFRYCLNVKRIKNVIFLGTIVCIGTTSINVAFYPFAFNILKITSKGWGVMMSIFYGTNLVAIFITALLRKNIEKKILQICIIPLALTSLVWLLYGMMETLPVILLLQFFEGSSLAFLNILLSTELQMAASPQILARVVGINDTINNIGKLSGIIFTYAALPLFAPQSIFLIDAVLLMIYVVYKLIFKIIRKNFHLKGNF